MTKVIFKVTAEQSPITFGITTNKEFTKIKKYFHALDRTNLNGCSYCGSSKPKEEAKEDNGKVSLICPDCQMDVIE